VLSPAAAAAAAAAAAGSVPPGSTVSVAEAVEGSPLAQLLTWAHVGAGGAAERRQRHNKQAMTLRSCIPQLSDMSDVNSIRCGWEHCLAVVRLSSHFTALNTPERLHR
jgi:hypothetical protein